MAKLNVKAFMKDSKKDGKMSNIFNLKDTGKAIGWFHPETGIESRKVHYLPQYKEMEDKDAKGKSKKKSMKVSGSILVCSGFDTCPVCQMKKALRADDNIGDDEVIFEAGEGKSVEESLKGDILGVEDYDWKKNLRTITEYLFGFINKDSLSDKVNTFIAPKSLGKAITKVIETKMEEAEDEGDVNQGDPFINPFAFRLTFDPDEQASLMYSASFIKAKITEEVQDLLDGEGTDLEALTKITPVNDVCDMLAEILIAEIDGFNIDDYRVSGNEKKAETNSKIEKNTKKKPAHKTPEKVEESEDDEEDQPLEDMEDSQLIELAEEYEITPKYTGRGKSKKLNRDLLIEAIEKKEAEDEEPEEEVVKKPVKKKVIEKKKKVPEKKEEIEEPDADEDLEDMEDSELLKLADDYGIEPTYKGRGSKKKLNRDALIEEITEYEEAEEEAPKKSTSKKDTTSSKKEKTSAGKKTSKSKGEDEEEMTECPSCGASIPESAQECPDCGTEFEDEEVVICPKCGTENEETATKCSKCRTKLIPF